MNKYIADFIRNNTNSLCNSAGCTKPQREAIRDMVSGLFQKGTPVLRQLGSRKTSNAKKESERFGNHLENVDVVDAVNDRALRKAASVLEGDDVIAYDLTDISKPCSKGADPETGAGMQWVKECFDGSKRKGGFGSALHGVGAGELLLRLRVHDTEKEFLPQVRKSILDEIVGRMGARGIWAFDRGNDDKKFFRYLNEKEIDGKTGMIKFIVRLKKNRDIILKDTGEVMKLEEMRCGRYEVYILDDHGKIDTNNTYLLIIRKHCKKYKNPIRILCSLNLKHFSGKTLVKKYLDRWGVENSFKRIKSLYELEGIRIIKKKRFVNLVALIQFVSVLSAKLYEKTQKTTSFLASTMKAVYTKYLKKESLTPNPHSFGTFLRTIIPQKYRSKPLGGKRPRDSLQITLFDFFDVKLGMS